MWLASLFVRPDDDRMTVETCCLSWLSYVNKPMYCCADVHFILFYLVALRDAFSKILHFWAKYFEQPSSSTLNKYIWVWKQQDCSIPQHTTAGNTTPAIELAVCLKLVASDRVHLLKTTAPGPVPEILHLRKSPNGWPRAQGMNFTGKVTKSVPTGGWMKQIWMGFHMSNRQIIARKV